jgi:hypothetical protein
MKQRHESAGAPLLGLVREALGAEAASVLSVLDFAEIADDEVRRAGNPKGVFEHLLPPREMMEMLPEVYRLHCRELIQRHARGGSLDFATDAEVLCALSAASLRFPLNRNATAAYVMLFRRILKESPGAQALDLDDPSRLEDYAGAAEELIQKMRRHRVRSVPRRRVKDAKHEPRQASLAELVDVAG